MKRQSPRHIFRTGFAGLLLALSVPMLVAAMDRTATQDQAISKAVLKEISEIRKLDMSQIQVATQNGEVTLSGSVPTAYMSDEAARKARGVRGVTAVINRLDVAVGEVSRDAIVRDALKSVRMYPFYTIFDNINLEVEGGIVRLVGQVSQPWHKADMGRLVSQVRGVRRVDNELEVLPVSIFDDQIRRRIALAIYRDPVLSGYALRADPTIHIVVKNGHVRLEGAVRSQVDKAIAGRNARFAAMFFSLENNLRVDKS